MATFTQNLPRVYKDGSGYHNVVTLASSTETGRRPLKLKISSPTANYPYWRNLLSNNATLDLYVCDLNNPGTNIKIGSTTVTHNSNSTSLINTDITISDSSNKLTGKALGFFFFFYSWSYTNATDMANMMLFAGSSVPILEFTLTTDTLTHTVTWTQDTGTTIDTSTVTHGATPTHSNPTKTATAQYNYTFAAWQHLENGTWVDGIVTCTGNTTYKARYTSSVRSYTITFQDHDGTTLQSGSVAYGSTPTYNGSTPSRSPTAQYEFSGWSPTITAVTGNATYTAQYAIRKYTVAWKNGSTTLETDTDQSYGTTPTYNGATPTKASTAEYDYTFSGWSPAVAAVTGDATYTATFSSQKRAYTITKAVSPSGAGTITSPSGANAQWGTTVTLAQTPATDYEFVEWQLTGATLSGNSFTMPKNDVTITAVYREAHKTVGRYNGTEMVECIAHYYTGSEWVEVEPLYYDGTEFKLCSLT